MSPLLEDNVKLKSKSKDYIRNGSFHEQLVYDIKYRCNKKLRILNITVLCGMSTCKSKVEVHRFVRRRGSHVF
jgi:hypothetical protein